MIDGAVSVPTKGQRLLNVFVDADACPVKQEVYRVAARHHIHVTLVANSWMRVPTEDGIVLQVVGNGLDEADNWIVSKVTPHDIVVTADILLASRCIKAGAHAHNKEVDSSVVRKMENTERILRWLKERKWVFDKNCLKRSE